MMARHTLPRGWDHPTHLLHRQWFGRRIWQWRVRQMLATLAVAVIAVLFGAGVWVLAFGLLGLLWPPNWPPVRLQAKQTLEEIEQVLGAAYTTALTAVPDNYGFSERLSVQAFNIDRNADRPAWPWLEGLAAVLIASLVFVWPASPARALVRTDPTPPTVTERETPVDPGNPEPVITEAGVPPGQVPGGEAAGQARAASSGALSEGEVGAIKPGGGQASDDPTEIQRDFQEALERGAVRSSGGAQAPQRAGRPNAQGRDGTGQSDSSGLEGDQLSGQDGTGQGNRSGANRKPGQNGRSKQGTQDRGQQGSQGDSDASGGSAQGKGQSGQDRNGKPNGGQNNGQSPNGDPRQPGRNGLEDEFGDPGSNGNRFGNGQAQRGQSGSGSREGSGPQAISPLDAKGQGKLEYLPGQAQGKDARSSALPLPGDARRPLTGTPGTPEYQRAVESAVQDPRLPPEYQEMLRNYYR